MKFDDLGIPSAVADELPLLRLFIDKNLQFHKNGHNFSELIKELNIAIIKYGEKKSENTQNCHIIGHCLIDPTVTILPGTTIIGPSIIGPDCEIGPNAYIRSGTILGPRVKVGFGAEIKESITGPDTIIAHFSYTGNSLIGENCKISASVVLSAKRLDLSKIRLWISKNQYMPTNCKKLGSVIGDNVRIGSGTIVMPGTNIGANSIIWPNIIVAKYIPENSIIKIEQGLNRNQNACESKNGQLEQLNLIADSYHQENNRFWTRNTVFVTINAALLAIFAAYGAKFSPFATFLLALFGLGTAYSWFQTIRMGKY